MAIIIVLSNVHAILIIRFTELVTICLPKTLLASNYLGSQYIFQPSFIHPNHSEVLSIS